MYASVLIPLPLAGPYDYAVPKGMVCEPGSIVEVPLGSRTVAGVVWDVHEADWKPNDVGIEKLKPIESRLDARPLPTVLLRFVDWVAHYTMTPRGSVLRLVLRVPAAFEAPKAERAFTVSGRRPTKTTRARERVLALLADGLPRTNSEIAHESGVSSGVIGRLADAGALKTVERLIDLPFPMPQSDFAKTDLSQAQQKAASGLVDAVERAAFSVSVLDGVPGSGKTETYFEAIAAALERGKQALILLPEIALTVQFLDRFAARFGERPAVWHSDLSRRARRRTWRAIAENNAAVVVGTRSALFLPYPNLGLIIIDEEHDTAFKQEEGVIYHARDMGVVRASLGDFPIILSSATPSLETLVNVSQGRYTRLSLPARHGTAVMPDVEAVDLRQDNPPAGRWLSPVLIEAIRETFDDGEQAVLFLNRRGYAPLTLCRKCGHRLTSPNTSSWLVEHRFLNRLVCHHSGFWMPKPKECPKCGAEDSLVGCGPGVERVAEEAKDLFPDRVIEIMSSDTVHGPDTMQKILGDMAAGKIDLLIGTQIIAKGHHFPNLTLVGVVDADLGLAGGDLRAGERTFQLLSQVAGRAGRGEKRGRVLLQTYMPEHDVMKALVAGDRNVFLETEAHAREDWGMPPYGRLASLIISGQDERRVRETGQKLARSAPAAHDIEVWGPAPAPFALLRGRHRQRLLVKAGRDVNLQSYLAAWLPQVKPPHNVRVIVDVDPYSFL